MKFTEEKAQELIKKFDLDDHTLAVWKTRGKIPDRYFKDGYQKPIALHDRVHEKMLTILESEKLNVKALAERSGIAYQKIKDAQIEKSSFSEQEYTAIKVALNTLRVGSKKFVESYRMKERFSDRETESFRKFLKNNRELVIAKVFRLSKIRDFKLGKVTAMRPEEYRSVIDDLSVFILETSLPEK